MVDQLPTPGSEQAKALMRERHNQAVQQLTELEASIANNDSPIEIEEGQTIPLNQLFVGVMNSLRSGDMFLVTSLTPSTEDQQVEFLDMKFSFFYPTKLFPDLTYDLQQFIINNENRLISGNTEVDLLGFKINTRNTLEADDNLINQLKRSYKRIQTLKEKEKPSIFTTEIRNQLRIGIKDDKDLYLQWLPFREIQ